MRTQHNIYLLVFCTLCAFGCLARQVAKDGISIRHVIMDMYTDQAMDNLIRAYENRPFVQLAYSQLSVIDEDVLGVTAMGQEADFSGSHSVDLSKAAAFQLSRGWGFTGRFPFGGSGERDRKLSFHADPITDQNHIYEAYTRFARTPRLFMVSDTQPTCPVYIMRKCGNKWFWVPMEAGNAFLQLTVETSFATEVDAYWNTTIQSVKPRYDNRGKAIAQTYVVQFSDYVPNDNGLVLINPKSGSTIMARIMARDLEPYLQNVDNQNPKRGPPRGEPTQILYMYSYAELQSDLLKDAVVRFIAENYPNIKPRPASDQQKVLDALDNIRLIIGNSAVGNP